MKFKNNAQRQAVMAKLTKGEKYFLYDCMKAFEHHGQTLGSRLMAKKIKKKIRYLDEEERKK